MNIKFMKKCFLIVILATIFILNLSFWLTNRITSSFSKLESDCGRFLDETEIILENDTWQILKTPDGSMLYFQNAYVDTRKKQNVTISTLGTGFHFFDKPFFCQLWIEGEVEPVVRQASIMESSLEISNLNYEI